MASAYLLRQASLSALVLRLHFLNAVRAALTASSKSSFVATGTSHNFSFVAGLTPWWCFALSTSLPLITLRYVVKSIFDGTELGARSEVAEGAMMNFDLNSNCWNRAEARDQPGAEQRERCILLILSTSLSPKRRVDLGCISCILVHRTNTNPASRAALIHPSGLRYTGTVYPLVLLYGSKGRPETELHALLWQRAIDKLEYRNPC